MLNPKEKNVDEMVEKCCSEEADSLHAAAVMVGFETIEIEEN